MGKKDMVEGEVGHGVDADLRHILPVWNNKVL